MRIGGEKVRLMCGDLINHYTLVFSRKSSGILDKVILEFVKGPVLYTFLGLFFFIPGSSGAVSHN